MQVVRMLQDMAAELQADLYDDKALHEKLDCWCTAGLRRKAEAIEGGEAKQGELEAFLGKTQGQMQETKSKREATQEEVDNDWASLNTASEARMQESKAFQTEEMQLQEAVAAADHALVVLGKHHLELAHVRSVAQRLQKVPAQTLWLKALGKRRATVLKAFLEEAQGATSFLAVPGFQSHAPRSGEVFGILKQMMRDFGADLDKAQASEKRAAAEFAALKEAKEEQLKAGKKLVRELDGEFADLGEASAQASQELDDTKNQLGLDRAALRDLKAKCSESDVEYDARVKSRMEEITAVEDTVQILNDDKSFDLFDQAVSAGSFLQTSAGSGSKEWQRRQHAASLLRRAAAAAGPRSTFLALLATRLELDNFTKVKVAIDSMAAALEVQQKDEAKHRDWCIKELHENNRSTAAASDAKEDLEVKRTELNATAGALEKTLEETTALTVATEAEMKQASETREAENAAFQKTALDQRVTQMVLQKALVRMKQVYTLAQGRERAPSATVGSEAPAGFGAYERHSGGARVIAAIERIVADAKAAAADAARGEQQAQAMYESFMKESNGAITSYGTKAANLRESLAEARKKVSMLKTDLAGATERLEELTKELSGLQRSCSFVLANFAARQEARAAEIGALKEARGVLAGMK